MKLKILIISGLLISTCVLNAQPDFRPGYIIKSSGDTIYGAIDYRGDLLMSRICRIKVNGNPIIEEYFPDEINAYRFIENKYYVSKEIDDNKVFLEFLINGKIKIYYLRNELGDHYYIENENEELAEIPYSEGTKIIYYTRRYYESKQHIEILSTFTQDAPELKTRIQNMKKPNHKNLVSLAEDYHHSVCKDEPCIIYEKKLPLLKVSLQPFAGTTKYKESNRFVNEVGGYIFIWAPRTNEKIFFKTGLKFLRIAEEGTVLNIYKIPIQLQYIYKAHRLQPEISGGVNFLTAKMNDYKGYGHTSCMNAGLNFLIFNTISLYSGIDFDFTPLSEIIFNDCRFELISYSVDVGLRIDL